MPQVAGVLETAVWVDDLDRAAAFYRVIFGFEPLDRSERGCAFSVGGRHILLLLSRAGVSQPKVTPGGIIPASRGSGESHVAFAIAASELAAWETWLQQNNVAIESKVSWERGGWSLYFRDPDNNSLELATPGTWSIY